MFHEIAVRRIDHSVLLQDDLDHEGTVGGMAAEPAHQGFRPAVMDRNSMILATSPDGIVTVNDAGNVVFANPAASRLIGVGNDALVGHNLLDVVKSIPGNDELFCWLSDPEAGVPAYHPDRTSLQLKRADGTLINLLPSRADTGVGAAHESTVFLRDVTEPGVLSRRARRTARRYAAITRQAVHALIVCANVTEESVIVSGEGVLGYPADTPLPEGFISLVHPEDQAATRAVIEEIRLSGPGTTTKAQARLRTASGDWLQCEYIAEDLSQDSAVEGVLVRAADITLAVERQRAVESTTARLRSLIDNLGSAVLLEDENRKVLVSNQEFANLFGIPLSPDEMAGMDCADAAETVKLQFADPEQFVQDISRLLTDAKPELGTVVLMKDGQVLERDYRPVMSGDRHVGNLWTYRNISAHVAQNQLLVDENRSLEQLAQLKNEFVARVSHELRSPLTSVVSFADMLAESTSGSLSEDESNFLDVINRNANRLLRLIEDLLLVAKLESHTLPLSLGLVDLTEIASQVVSELRPRARAKGIAVDLTCESGPKARADVLRIQQVISNLVGNAINYTPDGGAVLVEVVPETDQRRWRLSVSDTGVGIPQAEVEKLFEPFYRASTSQPSATGTGLGLAIVRLIVDQHSGTVDVSSTPGDGTRMTVYLPFDES